MSNLKAPSLLQNTRQLLALAAWLCPIPLLAVGLSGVLQPLIIVTALGIAFLPWMERWLRHKQIFAPTPLTNPLLLFGLSALLSLLAAYDPALSLPITLTLLATISLFFTMRIGHLSAKTLATGLVAPAALLSIYFTVEYAHFGYKYEVGLLADLTRYATAWLPNTVFFTPHPNAVAGFLVGSFLVNLVLIRQIHSQAQWLALATVAIIGYGLLLTGSRGAWAGLLAAAIIWALLILPQKASRFLAIAAVILLASALSIYLIIPHRYFPYFITSLPATVASRLYLYRNGLALFVSYPFTGIGLGDTFTLVYSRYRLFIGVPFYYYAHNLFLAVGLGQGLLGLVALLWLIAAFYRFVYQVEQSSSPPPAIFRAAWLGATATLIHGFTDAPQFSEDYWSMVMLFALLGLAVISAPNAVQDHASRCIPKLWRWGAIGMMLVASLWYFNIIAAIFWNNVGAVYQTKADLSPYLSQYERNAALAKAAICFDRAAALAPAWSTPVQRRGFIALSLNNWPEAIAYLEQSQKLRPGNQAVIKASAYAYLWQGDLDTAEQLFQQVALREETLKELRQWQQQWLVEGRRDLAESASQMFHRLE